MFFSFKLENADIQDFDLRWEQALLLTSDLPSDKVSEGLYVSKIDNYGTIQTSYSARRRKTRLSQTENVCEIAY